MGFNIPNIRSNTKLKVKTNIFSLFAVRSAASKAKLIPRGNENPKLRKYSNDAEKEDAEVEVKMSEEAQQQPKKKLAVAQLTHRNNKFVQSRKLNDYIIEMKRLAITNYSFDSIKINASIELFN